MTLSNSDNIIDSRDVIERIAELEALENDDDVDLQSIELAALKALAVEGTDYAPDWQYGETLIRDTHFRYYAEELAEDIGAINSNASWPLTYIDWDAAAEALKVDYTEVDFDGVSYWIRG